MKSWKSRFWLQKVVKSKITKRKSFLLPGHMYVNICHFWCITISFQYFCIIHFSLKDSVKSWKRRFWLQDVVKRKSGKRTSFLRPYHMYEHIRHFWCITISFQYFWKIHFPLRILENHEKVVFGYKNLSKVKVEKEKVFFEPIICMNIFVIFGV